VLVIALLLFLTLDRGDPSGTAATRTPSGSSPSGAIDPAELVAHLPADLTGCAAGRLAGDGDVAAASCGAAATQPGPAEADFYLYPDVATLDAVFASDVRDEGLPEFTGSADCTTGTGFGQWSYPNGSPGGEVACQITDEGSVVVVWTDHAFLTEGAVRAPGSTQAEVSALYEWWTAHSEYRN
jgi:hypothetical protein